MNNKLFIIALTATVLLTACGSTAGNDSKKTEDSSSKTETASTVSEESSGSDENSEESSDVQTESSEETEASEEPEETELFEVPDTLSGDTLWGIEPGAEWCQAYIDFIYDAENYWGDTHPDHPEDYQYTLIYLDGDEVPELFIKSNNCLQSRSA